MLCVNTILVSAGDESDDNVLRAASYVKPTPSLRLPPTKSTSLDTPRPRTPSPPPPPKPALRRVLTPEPPPVHADLHPKINRKKSVPLPASKKPLINSPGRSGWGWIVGVA